MYFTSLLNSERISRIRSEHNHRTAKLDLLIVHRELNVNRYGNRSFDWLRRISWFRESTLHAPVVFFSIIKWKNLHNRIYLVFECDLCAALAFVYVSCHKVPCDLWCFSIIAAILRLLSQDGFWYFFGRPTFVQQQFIWQKLQFVNLIYALKMVRIAVGMHQTNCVHFT